jgi:hypothetical protein
MCGCGHSLGPLRRAYVRKPIGRQRRGIGRGAGGQVGGAGVGVRLARPARVTAWLPFERSSWLPFERSSWLPSERSSWLPFERNGVTAWLPFERSLLVTPFNFKVDRHYLKSHELPGHELLWTCTSEPCFECFISRLSNLSSKQERARERACTRYQERDFHPPPLPPPRALDLHTTAGITNVY